MNIEHIHTHSHVSLYFLTIYYFDGIHKLVRIYGFYFLSISALCVIFYFTMLLKYKIFRIYIFQLNDNNKNNEQRVLHRCIFGTTIKFMKLQIFGFLRNYLLIIKELRSLERRFGSSNRKIMCVCYYQFCEIIPLKADHNTLEHWMLSTTRMVCLWRTFNMLLDNLRLQNLTTTET